MLKRPLHRFFIWNGPKWWRECFLCLEVVKEWSLSSTSKRDFWSSQEELKEDFEALKKKKNLLFDGATTETFHRFSSMSFLKKENNLNILTVLHMFPLCGPRILLNWPARPKILIIKLVCLIERHYVKLNKNISRLVLRYLNKNWPVRIELSLFWLIIHINMQKHEIWAVHRSPLLLTQNTFKMVLTI